jgi:DNA-binding NtrC family response regulator
MQAGRFRQDLFWRIHVVSVRLPPLRERREDLPLLIDHMLDRFNGELGLSVRTIDPVVRQLLLAYDWPGNVRELENALCRAMIVSEGGRLAVADLPARVRGEADSAEGAAAGGGEPATLAEAVQEAARRVETSLILRRLADHAGNREATAKSLGVSRKTLFNKMRQHGIDFDAAPSSPPKGPGPRPP